MRFPYENIAFLVQAEKFLLFGRFEAEPFLMNILRLYGVYITSFECTGGIIQLFGV